MKMPATISSAGPATANSESAGWPPAGKASAISASEMPVPDTRRFGAWVKKASPDAAAMPRATSSNSTLFLTHSIGTLLQSPGWRCNGVT